MSTEFLMPKLGLTMEEGTILQWLVADGAEIEPGTAVLVIETDKVESEVEAHASGRLHRLGEEGQTFRCGEVIGLLLAEGETAVPATSAPATALAAASPAAHATVIDAAPAAAPTGAGGRRFVSPNARRLAAERNLDLDSVRGTGPGGRVVSEDLDQAATALKGPASSRVPATAWPSAPSQSQPGQSLVPASVAGRVLADLLGVDLAVVPPDPIDGYVTREAVARYVRGRLAESVVHAVPAKPAVDPAPITVSEPLQPNSTIRPMSRMRSTIAKRMVASLHDMAQLTLTMDADMDAVFADRRSRITAGAAPSYTDYVIAAAARALRAHPVLNSQVTPDGIAQLPDIHVGLAVALDGGLMVPVVRHTDRLSLAELAETTTALATATRSGSLTLQELEGGTFSVSALGAFGVDSFTPVINPPNAAILGIGRVRDDLVLNDGVVTAAKRMTLSLTWDHRVLDGAPAAQFCKAIVDLLRDPSMLDSTG